MPREGLRERQAAVARAVQAWARRSYGPHGGWKLVLHAEADGELMPSAASALREASPQDPLLAPYLAAVRTVQDAVGDGATGALLLASGLVEAALADPPRRIPGHLQGHALARRQALARLAALAQPAPLAALAASGLGPDAWQQDLLRGLPRQARGGVLPLADLDILAGTLGGGWLDGPLVPRRVRAASGRVVLASRADRVRGERGWRVRRADVLAGVRAEEEARMRAGVLRLREEGVALVVLEAADEAWADALEAAGIAAWQDAPASAVRRLEAATGAALAPTLAEAEPSPEVAFLRRRDGTVVRGAHAGQTYAVGVAHAGLAPIVRDEAERLLRVVAAHGEDARGVPGGGAWQRLVARDLLRAAPLAPGNAPVGVQAAGRVLLTMAELLPPPPHAGLQDPLAVARATVDAGFAAAAHVLRLDAMHARRASNVQDLRGPGTPLSARELGGNVPEHM